MLVTSTTEGLLRCCMCGGGRTLFITCGGAEEVEFNRVAESKLFDRVGDGRAAVGVALELTDRIGGGGCLASGESMRDESEEDVKDFFRVGVVAFE